jgi:hypothetical protein
VMSRADKINDNDTKSIIENEKKKNLMMLDHVEYIIEKKMTSLR